MEIVGRCMNCKHKYAFATEEPCRSCSLEGKLFSNWESGKEKKETIEIKERINTKMNYDEINFATENMNLLNTEIEIINGNKYLHFIYDYKDSYKKGKLHLVCYLPTSVNYPQFEYNACSLPSYDTKVNLGLDGLWVKDCRLENIEYNVKEMTIEEIEKQLGHKVKIIGEDK